MKRALKTFIYQSILGRHFLQIFTGFQFRQLRTHFPYMCPNPCLSFCDLCLKSCAIKRLSIACCALTTVANVLGAIDEERPQILTQSSRHVDMNRSGSAKRISRSAKTHLKRLVIPFWHVHHQRIISKMKANFPIASSPTGHYVSKCFNRIEQRHSVPSS